MDINRLDRLRAGLHAGPDHVLSTAALENVAYYTAYIYTHK